MPYMVNPDTGYLEWREGESEIIPIVDKIGVDTASGTGTNPVVPDGSNQINITGGQVISGDVGANVIQTHSESANSLTVEIQQAGASATENTALNGVSHFDSDYFSVSNGFVSITAIPPQTDTTYQANTGSATPAANVLNVLGATLSSGTNASVTSGSGNTLTVTSINTAKWIVDPTANRGTHQTITAAVAAATSGQTIFVRPGTYTENFTWPAGIDICAFECDAHTPSVTIIGKITCTDAGRRSMSGIRLKTNSDNFLAITGTSSSIVIFVNCYFDVAHNVAGFFCSSSGGAKVQIYTSSGDLTSATASFFNFSAGGFFLFNSNFFNSASSNTPSTLSGTSAGSITNSIYYSAITTSGSSSLGAYNSDLGVLNAGLILGGTGTNDIHLSTISSGTASAISIGVGASISLSTVNISSSNTNAITGLGAIAFSNVVFNGNSIINTTSQTYNYTNHGKWKASGQPAFLALLSAVASNVSGDGTNYTIIFDTEIFDQDSNYNNTNGIFTAPITGKYQLQATVYLFGGTSLLGCNFTLVTSNRTYRIDNTVAGQTAYSGNIIALVDMDAGDTATVHITSTDTGGKVDDLFGAEAPFTYFSGFLTC